MDTDDHILITKAEAARVLGISRETIARLVRRGVLTEVRLSPTMNPRLRRADVIALGRGERPVDR